MTERNDKQRIEDGWKLGKVTIRLIQSQNKKLLISRNDRGDLPHLTISCGNASKEFDVHLTTRGKGGEEYHEPLATIPEADLENAAESFGTKLAFLMQSRMAELRKVRPGWLARNGYWLLYLPKAVQDQLIEGLAPRVKRHGKWTREVKEDFIEHLAQSEEFLQSIRHPSVLHEVASIGFDGTIPAQSARRRKRRRLIILSLVTRPDGKKYWVRIERLAQDLLNNSQDFIGQSIRALFPPDTWSKIHTGLRLDEIGIDADGNRSSRS